jgi:23S rRNA maturation mini-RNase III
MNEAKNDVSSKEKKNSEPQDTTMETKLDEMIGILKNIDDKLATIARAIREINARG